MIDIQPLIFLIKNGHEQIAVNTDNYFRKINIPIHAITLNAYLRIQKSTAETVDSSNLKDIECPFRQYLSQKKTFKFLYLSEASDYLKTCTETENQIWKQAFSRIKEMKSEHKNDINFLSLSDDGYYDENWMFGFPYMSYEDSLTIQCKLLYPNKQNSLSTFYHAKNHEYDDMRFPYLCIQQSDTEGNIGSHYLSMARLNFSVDQAMIARGDGAEEYEKWRDDYQKIVQAIKHGPKPTACQIVLTILCALTHTGLFIGLLQLALTSFYALWYQCTWRPFLISAG